jgi:hypothetical protein
MLSLCFKARPPFSMMKKHHSCHSRRKEGENDAAALSKVQILTIQNKKDDRQTNKKPNSLVCKISKFKKIKNSILTHTYINFVISGAAHRENDFNPHNSVN